MYFFETLFWIDFLAPHKWHKYVYVPNHSAKHQTLNRIAPNMSKDGQYQFGIFPFVTEHVYTIAIATHTFGTNDQQRARVI